MDFGEASHPTRIDDNTWTMTTGDSWQQGRTIFGGLVAANLVNAMSGHAAPTHELRVLSTTMASPVPSTGATITTRLDRVGKSTSFVSATITDGDTLCTRATAVFAASRPSTLTVPGTCPALEKDFASAAEMPYMSGAMPEYLQHFSLRFGLGDFPYAGADRGVLGGYCRHNTASAGVAAIVALLDVWPPAILPMASEPVAGSTIQWTAHIIDPRIDIGDDWFEFGYHTVAAHSGYTISEGTLSRDGHLVAWTEQLGAIFG